MNHLPFTSGGKTTPLVFQLLAQPDPLPNATQRKGSGDIAYNGPEELVVHISTTHFPRYHIEF